MNVTFLYANKVKLPNEKIFSRFARSQLFFSFAGYDNGLRIFFGEFNIAFGNFLQHLFFICRYKDLCMNKMNCVNKKKHKNKNTTELCFSYCTFV